MFHKCLNEMLEISERAPSFQPDQLHEAVYFFNEWNGSAGIYYNYEKNIVWTMNFISDEDYKRYQKENLLFQIYGKTDTDPDIEISLNELLGKVQYEYVRKKRFYNNKALATEEATKEINDKIQRIKFIKAIQSVNIEGYDNETIKQVYDLLFSKNEKGVLK